jgi:hypothetical protein
MSVVSGVSSAAASSYPAVQVTGPRPAVQTAAPKAAPASPSAGADADGDNDGSNGLDLSA